MRRHASIVYYHYISFHSFFFFFFFFNDTATTEIYTLSLHDALPISLISCSASASRVCKASCCRRTESSRIRSEEHTSEHESQSNLVCRLLLEKKKKKKKNKNPTKTKTCNTPTDTQSTQLLLL